jgi:hypothetical protein
MDIKTAQMSAGQMHRQSALQSTHKEFPLQKWEESNNLRIHQTSIDHHLYIHLYQLKNINQTDLEWLQEPTTPRLRPWDFRPETAHNFGSFSMTPKSATCAKNSQSQSQKVHESPQKCLQLKQSPRIWGV